MPRNPLAGTRLRERRMLAGLRQADVARAAGISAAYLNLIEHNRRRAGPDLIAALARALGVDPRSLAEGSDSALFDTLREAAASVPAPPLPETDRIEEFVGRYPGWSALLAARHDRVAALERTVETFNNRMAHDPHLSASVHEVLSAVTSVRSTAAILAETEDIDPVWRARFHRNLAEDSERLTEAAATLVGWLDETHEAETGLTAPLEEVESWLAATGYHLAALEGPRPLPVAALLADAPELVTGAARRLAQAHAETYAADAAALPLAALLAAIGGNPAPDPGDIARRTGAGLPTVFRRLAALPVSAEYPACGLVACDGSGTLTFRRQIAGFAMPRFGGACPLWPLFQAMRAPAQPVRVGVEMAGQVPRRFRTFALAETTAVPDFDMSPVIRAMMLIQPDPASRRGDERPVGSACRVCPRAACPARREPSILTEAGQAAYRQP